MNYKEAISFLFSSLPMYQRVGGVAYKSNLDTTLALDDYFGHPHRKFQSIHVAGTNGKGSVSHMLAAIYQSAGYKTGLYTSPHLTDFRERIRVNGQMIPEKNVVGFVDNHMGIIKKLQPSFFEMTVAMAFEYFSMEKVDIAIVEVGMGGRLDSTNIIHPELSVITNIGMDHSQFLGETLYKIAGEKAGIIKPGVPVVVGQTQEDVSMVFIKRAKELNCPLYFSDDEMKVEYSMQTAGGKQSMQVYRRGVPWMVGLETDLMGMYQKHNMITVLKVIEVMAGMGKKVSEDALRTGLAQTGLLTGIRGRWQILGNNPLIVCDTVHNPEGMREVVSQIRQTPWKSLFIILGMVNDKPPGRLMAELPREALYFFTQSGIPRAMDREKLAREALEYGLYGKVCSTPLRALELAKSSAAAEDFIFIGGSSFLVAELL